MILGAWKNDKKRVKRAQKKSISSRKIKAYFKKRYGDGLLATH